VYFVDEVTIEKIVELAKGFTKDGKKWHFHMLSPGCVFNTTDKEGFVLENCTDKQIWVCYSDKRYMKEGKELVQLVHGKGIVSDKKTESNTVMDKIIERCKELNGNGIHWHHHMLFPDCIFNEHGKWCIVFEDPETGERLEFLSDTEPKDQLARIEVLFYAQSG
jgi:hypothetical protein